jgi:hypothetical protein
VTASELLAMLGRAWSRLLIYPGGLTAFAIIWLISTLQNREPGTQNGEPARMNDSQLLVLSSIVAPWLALALLPLPLAAGLPRQVDIVVALALLEWPQILATSQALRAGGTRRLAAALNSYPTLVLATLALAQPAGSLDIVALARPPSELASASASALHWLGAVALALALAPALGLGPFGDGGRSTKHQGRHCLPTANPQSPIPSLHSPVSSLRIGLRLRALGLIALAALPWAGGQDDGLALLRILAAASVLAALLWGYDRLAGEHAPRRWARAYLALDAILLLALLWAAYAALQSRLA